VPSRPFPLASTSRTNQACTHAQADPTHIQPATEAISELGGWRTWWVDLGFSGFNFFGFFGFWIFVYRPKSKFFPKLVVEEEATKIH
jgi:hypothetical protein